MTLGGLYLLNLSIPRCGCVVVVAAVVVFPSRLLHESDRLVDVSLIRLFVPRHGCQEFRNQGGYRRIVRIFACSCTNCCDSVREGLWRRAFVPKVVASLL